MKSRTLPNLVLSTALAIWTAAAGAEIVIAEPWIRGMVAGQSDTGAFMTIRSSDSLQLISASSPVAKNVEIHKMTTEQGVMRMRPIKSLDIPANSPVELKPGGYHVMLRGVAKPLMKGDKVQITLVFQNPDGKKVSTVVQADVHALGAAARTDMKKMH